MTKLAYRNAEGKLVKLNTANDECLWSGHWVAGRDQSRFDELYLHITKSGQKIVYVAHVTYWQGEENEITVLDNPQEWLEDNYSRLTEKEIARLEELGFKVEETA